VTFSSELLFELCPIQSFARDADVDNIFATSGIMEIVPLRLLRDVSSCSPALPPGKLERDRELAPVATAMNSEPMNPSGTSMSESTNAPTAPAWTIPGVPERHAECLLVECREPPEYSFEPESECSHQG